MGHVSIWELCSFKMGLDMLIIIDHQENKNKKLTDSSLINMARDICR